MVHEAVLRLLNSTVLNVLILYRETTEKRTEPLSHWVQLVEGLFIKYGIMVNHKVQGQHLSNNTVQQLIEKHFIRRIPPTGKKSKPQRQCTICSKRGKRRDAVYWCENYDVGLCLHCFEDYHTKLNV
jgi:hypothetical protein